MNDKFKIHLSGVGKSIIYGMSFVFIKIALKNISIFSLLGLRFTLAVLLMIGMHFLKLIDINGQKNILDLIKLSILYPVLYFIFETIGLKYTSSTQAGIMMALIPVIVAIFSTFILKEKPNKIEIGFILISISGILFITIMNQSGNERTSCLGFIALLIAIICLALHNVMVRKISDKFSPTRITFSMMCVSAIVFDLIFVVEKLINKDFQQFIKIITNTEVVLSILYLGVLSSVIGTFFSNYMLSKVTANQASVYANLTTVITIIAGVVLLNENFHWYEFVGTVLIIIGIWGTNYYGNK